MPVLDNGARDQYTATAAQTVFPYTFEILDKEDVSVEVDGVLKAEGTDYTVSGVGNDSGGNITFLVGRTAGEIITIYRDMELKREQDYQQSGDFLADEVDADFDRLWLAIQQQKSSYDLSLRADKGDSVLNSTNTVISDVSTRANKVLGFDNTGAPAYVGVNLASGDYKYFATVAAAQADNSLQVGDVIIIGERANALFDVIAATTNNGYDIIDGTASSVSLRIRNRVLTGSTMYGAENDGTTDDSGNIGELLSDFGVVYTSSDWWTKWKTVEIDPGNRIAVGSYQSGYSGIIDFADLTWPVNCTVRFNAGSGERVEHQNSIADDTTPVNEWRFESPYHPAIVLNQRTAASYTEAQPAHSLGNAATREFASILFQQDTVDQFQFFTDLALGELQVKTFPPIAGSFLSQVWQIDAETGNQGCQINGIASGFSFHVGGKMRIETGSNAINGANSITEPELNFKDATNATESNIHLESLIDALQVVNVHSTPNGSEVFQVGAACAYFQEGTFSGVGSTQSSMRIGQTTNGRSISASGTINASGADYAEYMLKRDDCGEINKGDVCGIDKEGKLTDKFDEAVSFCIKSTKPSLVGNDQLIVDIAGEQPEKYSTDFIDWKNKLQEIESSIPPKPELHASDYDDNGVVKEENFKRFKKELKDWRPIAAKLNKQLEGHRKARPKKLSDEYEAWEQGYKDKISSIDRIAFCGQVPVNYKGEAGEYLIPVNKSGSIDCIAKKSPSFDEYLKSVGRFVKPGVVIVKI